jgi:hypothetical protein
MKEPVNHELVAPLELAPGLPVHITAAESVRVWIDLMRSADKLVLAGFVREVGPELARDAYARWCAEQFEGRSAHLAALVHRLRELGD